MKNSFSKARQRINTLLDRNSFVEIGAKVTARSTNFNLSPEQTPSDGVITGYGLIDGSLVYVYSQDAAVIGGSVGEMHAKKIASIYDLAIRTGAPVIGMIESSGFRLQEGVDALNAFGTIYKRLVKASGLILKNHVCLQNGVIRTANFCTLERLSLLCLTAPGCL